MTVRKKVSNGGQADITESNRQGVEALLRAIVQFLLKNDVSFDVIQNLVCNHATLIRHVRTRKELSLYGELTRTNESMGVIMGTWFSHPKFLDASGNPIPLRLGTRNNSLSALIRASGARLKQETVLSLMRQSRSIAFESDGSIIAKRRVFVLPGLSISRAAFIIERFLETLQQNQKEIKPNTVALLERSCHVSEIDLKKVAPLLRDIKIQGTSFLDAVDGNLEYGRKPSAKSSKRAELGVLVFAWMRPKKSRY